MSEFAELLNEYLNFEDFGFKDEDYEKEEKESIKTASPFTIDDSISINKYVTSYLGYQMDCNNLYHCGLRELNLDYVIGVDNNFANKNPEYVKKGFLLIVIDAKGKRGTYLNPVYIFKFVNEKNDIESLYNTFHKLQEVELKKLNVYLEKYKKAKLAYDEITKFTIVLNESHKMKKVKRLERRNKNDKY